MGRSSLGNSLFLAKPLIPSELITIRSYSETLLF